MNLERWTAVDRYLSDLFVPPDPVLEATLQASEQAGLPLINVTPIQGKFLQLLANMQGAKRILEIGTLGGYSTLWLARALPADGRLITLEFEPKHAAVARKNFARAGVAGTVELRLGPAVENLRRLVTGNCAPFDFIFIDADKESYPDYLAWSLRLSRRGTCIIADNIVRNGAVIDPASEDPRVRGVRRFNELLASDPRVTATALQTVSGKGYDGFTIAIVTVAA